MFGKRGVLSRRGMRFLSTVTTNGRSYALPRHKRPIVAICLDGTAPEYLEEAKDVMPNMQAILSRVRGRGSLGIVAGCMPTFTNVNNVSIISGVSPKVHGISGNYFYDQDKNEEVMMTDPAYMRADSILASLAKADVCVTVLTAKDKLTRLLGSGLSNPSYALSIEKMEESDRVAPLKGLMDGGPPPTIYDPEISLYMLELGQRLVETTQDDSDKQQQFYYLSSTDFVQHKHAPGTPDANAFYARVDAVIGALDEAGAVVGLTADHGMNEKVRYDGSPRVVMLADVLEEQGIAARVICPITDPYVAHHGALGSYATVYVEDPADVDRAIACIREHDGVYTAVPRDVAASSFELPADRIGDIVVVGDEGTVLGKSASYHDLSDVAHLRSHGGLFEQTVPMFINRPLTHAYARKLTRGKARNYDLFDYLCNGVVH